MTEFHINETVLCEVMCAREVLSKRFFNLCIVIARPQQLEFSMSHQIFHASLKITQKIFIFTEEEIR